MIKQGGEAEVKKEEEERKKKVQQVAVQGSIIWYRLAYTPP